MNNQTDIDELIAQAPENSVEYKVYHGTSENVSNSELSRRIDWLQLLASSRVFNVTYRKAVILYLQTELSKRRQNW